MSLASRTQEASANSTALLQMTLRAWPSCSYEDGANISDSAVLLEVGRQLGLPEEELQAALG